jgi:hypothetical protein
MLREKMTSLIKKSIKEELAKIEDYSAIYFKVQIADNFTKGGVFSKIDHYPNFDYLISYADRLEFFKIYNEALLTDERFNNIEIHFDKEMNTDAKFIWDQAFYDADVEGNKKLKKRNHDALIK